MKYGGAALSVQSMFFGQNFSKIAFANTLNAHTYATNNCTFSGSLRNPSIIIAVVSGLAISTLGTPTDTALNTYVDCGAGSVLYHVSGARMQMFYALNTSTTLNNKVT